MSFDTSQLYDTGTSYDASNSLTVVSAREVLETLNCSSENSEDQANQKKNSTSSPQSSMDVMQPVLTGDIERPLACAHRIKTFKRRSHFSEHVRAFHLNLRPHACQICAMKFTRKCSLNKHKLLHARNREEERCGKAESSVVSDSPRHSNSLLRAVLTEKLAHLCMYCGKKFSRRGHMAVHVRSMHTRETTVLLQNLCKKFPAAWAT